MLYACHIFHSKRIQYSKNEYIEVKACLMDMVDMEATVVTVAMVVMGMVDAHMAMDMGIVLEDDAVVVGLEPDIDMAVLMVMVVDSAMDMAMEDDQVEDYAQDCIKKMLFI